MTENKKDINISTFWILLLVFLVLNLFMYSIISIGLYKLICYDKTNDLYTLIFLEKYTYTMYSDSNGIYILYIISELSDYFYTIETNFLFLYDSFHSYEYQWVDHKWDSLTLQSFSLMNDEDPWIHDGNKNVNLIFMNFFIRSTHLNWIQSLSLQKTIILNFNESSLFFFRIYNPTHVSVKLLTLYLIYPNFLTLYINKIQCFCFNAIFLYPLELVDLPVLIYVYPFSNNFLVLNNIIIYYVIFLN